MLQTEEIRQAPAEAKQEETPEIQPAAPEPIVEETEYSRSVGSLQQVSVDTFKIDKNNILNIIQELGSIMERKDFKSWQQHVCAESRAYWSNTQNLAAVSNRLPVKGIRLRSLEDYFNWVFIPSRKNRNNDMYEIRYTGENQLKAVQMQNDEDIIFYTFIKQNDRWLLYLDTL